MRYTILSLVVLLFLYVPVSHAQTHLDSLLTYPLFLKGDSLQQAGHYQDAIDHLEQAARDYRSSQRWRDYFYTENKICENLWRLGQYDTAWQVAQQVQEESAERLGQGYPTGIYTYFNVAFLHHIYGRYEEALANYHTALAIAKRHPASYPLLYDDLYHGASISYERTGEYDSAIAYCRRGLFIRIQQGEAAQVEIAKSYAQLGIIHGDLNSQDSFLWYNQRALAVQLAYTGEDHPHVAKYQAYVGGSYHVLGIYDSAAHYCQKALAGYKKHLGETHYYTALVLANLGDIYYDQDGYHRALSYYQQAFDVSISLFGQNHHSLATRYNQLGNTQSKLGNNTEALANYHKALAISHAIGDEDIQHLLNNLGDLHADEIQYDSAVWYARRALSVGKHVRGAQHLSIAVLYNTLGEIFYKKLQYDSAVWYHKCALAVWKGHQITKHSDLALLYEKLGNAYFALNDHKEALTNYQSSLKANTIDPDGRIDLGFKQYISNEILLSAVHGQAQALQQSYEQTNNIAQLEEAFITYLRYDSLITQMQTHRYRQEDQLLIQQTAKKVYGQGLAVGMDLYRITQDPTYWHRMFQLAEQSRTIALRGALTAYEAKKFSGIPAAVLAQERNVKLKRAQYQTLLQKSQEDDDTTQVQRCRTILLGLDQRYDSLMRVMESEYPRYHQLKYQSEAITVAELQEKLDKNTTALAYFLGEETGYAFAITANRLRVRTFPHDSLLSKQIDQLRASIQPRVSQSTYQGFVTSAADLYQKLLQPIISDITPQNASHQLVIIPDGKLSLLPFELLLTEASSPETGDYRSLPYLINDYRVSYSYSATWQFHERTANAASKAPSYLAMAPTYGNANTLAYGALRSEVTPLRWNQEEVADLDAYLSGNAFVGTAATEQRFKREAFQYAVLHLATHALVSDEHPDQSGLVFAPPESSDEDGLLQMHELYAMELPAQLAVLSACNTGGGKLQEGEGVMSLARAFAYAGCPSIIMSHWAVDDQATAQLMKFFYQHLADGTSKDEALRQAKLSLLTMGEANGNPFYWASFSVVGNTQPLARAFGYERLVGYLILGLATVALVMGVIYHLRKRD